MNFTDLDFPDFFRTTNCQPFECHLKWSKSCSPSTHPQIPRLGKHRHLRTIQTPNSMPELFWTWNCLVKTNYFRDPRPDQVTVLSLIELCNISENYCIHSFIYLFTYQVLSGRHQGSCLRFIFRECDRQQVCEQKSKQEDFTSNSWKFNLRSLLISYVNLVMILWHHF